MDAILQHFRRWAGSWPIALTIALVILADQVTKYVIRDNLALAESWPRGWAVRFTHAENTGSAFGLFTDQTTFLVAASVVAICVILYMFRSAWASGIMVRVSLAMMLAGGVSNLIDRLRYRQVTDFIDFQVWPIFNVADSSVVIGIVLLAFLVIFKETPAANRDQ